MKREELKAMGLTDEQVESVMAKNGAEVAALNTQITTLQSEKSQLENDKKVITKEKEDKEKAIADLQKNSISKDEYDKKIKEIEENAKKENEDYIYNDLLNKGLDDAKVLFSSGSDILILSIISMISTFIFTYLALLFIFKKFENKHYKYFSIYLVCIGVFTILFSFK